MPALGDARRQDGAGDVDLGHDPAAEDVAVAVGVGRHRHHPHHELAVVGQLQRRDAGDDGCGLLVEISGILRPPRSGRPAAFFHQCTPTPAADATRRPVHAAAPPPAGAARRPPRVRLAHARASCCPTSGHWRWRVLVALACLVGGQARQHRRAAGAQEPGRRARPQARRPARALVVPVGAAARLRRAARCRSRSSPSCASSCSIRSRRASRGASRSRRSSTCCALSLRFHLERQTGGVSRDIERGSRSIQSLLNYTIYNILPTLVEITLVIVLLSAKFDGWFAAITFGALVLYIAFTVTRDRMAHRISGAR